MNRTKYPLYIISKGRADSRLTQKAIAAMNVPYHIVIEAQEYDDYARHIPKENILVLPFSNLGLGSIPARNWVWEHSTDTGDARHWIIDDNIRDFSYFNRNNYHIDRCGYTFRKCEEFVDRFENVPMAGMQYLGFVVRSQKYKNPFTFNQRIYSCTLLSNKTAFRWRGRYNEDTDLSLRFLKAGYVTILFYAFICRKMATMTVKGGNTDQLYKQTSSFDGRLEMALHLQRQHPDVTTVYRRWDRWQHKVDYSGFRNNKPILRPEYAKVPA